MFIVQRYCAKNDASGNPRRVYVIRDGRGDVVLTVDEGYRGGNHEIAIALTSRGVDGRRALYAELASWWRSHPDVVDLGDVDVAPGVYRRMVRYATD